MKPQEYITERDKVTKKSIEKIDAAIPNVQREIFKRVVGRIDELEVTPDGRVKPTAKNLKIINDIVKRDAKSFFLDEEYEEAILDFVGSFKELGKITRQYFKKIESARPADDIT